jgi:SAM-dependent methyltransferase
MANKKSPITREPGQKHFVKSGVQYYKDELNNWFCAYIKQDDLVGGGNEEPRNSNELNDTRLQRIKQITGKQNPAVLDYGCGNGLMVRYFQAQGVRGNGFDKFNPKFNRLELGTGYDCVTLTEVIEHLTEPWNELKQIHDCLAPNGKVMIETSFTDWLTPDDIYVEPSVGHCTIFSHIGLDHLMARFGFQPGVHINRNVRIYEVG